MNKTFYFSAKMMYFSVMLVILIAAFTPGGMASAATITVNPAGGADYTTIAAAVAAAASYDTIECAAGNYTAGAKGRPGWRGREGRSSRSV